MKNKNLNVTAYIEKAKDETKFDDEKLTIKGVVMSTGAQDRHGDTVNPDGWDLKNFKKNPVLLAFHSYWSTPVGRVAKVWVEKGKALMGNLVFSATERGREFYQLYKEGSMSAFSVGFIVKDWGDPEKDKFTIMKQELLELSCVPVPANAEALVKMKEVAPLLCKDFEEKAPDKWAEILAKFAEIKEEKPETDSSPTLSKGDESEETPQDGEGSDSGVGESNPETNTETDSDNEEGEQPEQKADGEEQPKVDQTPEAKAETLTISKQELQKIIKKEVQLVIEQMVKDIEAEQAEATASLLKKFIGLMRKEQPQKSALQQLAETIK